MSGLGVKALRFNLAAIVATSVLVVIGLLSAVTALAEPIVGPDGPSGSYAFGSSDCTGGKSDPVGVLFRGRHGGPTNVAKFISKETGWEWTENDNPQGLLVHQTDGSYGCRATDVARAEHTVDGPFSRYHIRLWYVPASQGTGEAKTVGTPHHEDWVWDDPLTNHCTGATYAGNHAVDEGGVKQEKESGFTRGRHKLKEDFQGRHAIESEYWGNTVEFEQCDNGWAGSDGWGITIWINNSLHPRTGQASSSSSTGMALHGTLDTEEPTTEWWFGYGPSSSQGVTGYPYKTAVQSTYVTGEFNVSEAVSNLAPNTKYFVRLFARNQYGEVEEGEEVQLRLPPEAETGPVVWFPVPHEAMGTGRVNPNGLPTTYWWQYGISTNYGMSTAAFEAGAAWEWQWVEQPITALKGSTTYHARLVASNEYSSSIGEDTTFVTPDWRPISITEPAVNVKAHSATLSGKINPQGEDTHYFFEYGPTTSYGSRAPISEEADIGSGTTSHAVSQEITNLEINTTYHFRVVARNGEGTSVGADREFRTPNRPSIQSEEPSYVNTFEPQVNATVNPERAQTYYQFEYGTAPGSYTNIIPVSPAQIGSGSAGVPIEQTLKGLQRDTTYYYRLSAGNEVGTTTSGEQSFKTLPACKGLEQKCLWATQSAAEPPPIAEDEMKSVACPSTAVCIAVGRDTHLKKGFIERWNGSVWSLMQEVPGEIKKVSCASTTSCVAIGVSASGFAQSWLIYETSGSWLVTEKAAAAPAGSSEAVLNSVSCTATSCTAVGSSKAESTYKALVETWNGSAWSIVAAPGPNEGSAQNGMLGVSCLSSPLSCVAVGEAAGKPVAEGWAGAEWMRLPAPLLPTGAAGGKFASVSCTSSACFAVGDSYEGATGSERTLVERWNGNNWTILTSPNSAESKGFNNFTGISCTSASACVASGYFASKVSGTTPIETKTLVESYNGSTWSIQSSSNMSEEAFNALQDVSCASASACTAVGAGSPTLISTQPLTLAERWNGSGWSTQATVNPSTPTEDELKSSACPASVTCVAVGRNIPTGGSFIERWNGSNWTMLQEGSGEATKVACISATACVAVGNSQGAAQSWMINEVLGSWQVAKNTPPLPTGGSEGKLTSVSCTGTFCTAVGSYKSESIYKPLVEYLHNGSWSLQTAPGPVEGNAQKAMLGISCGSFRGTNTCMAVGEAASKPVAERWNGSEWLRTSAPPLPTTSAKLAAVSCGSISTCMAVGDSYEAAAGSENALVERWNGSNWSILTSPIPSEAKGFINLDDVSCLSPNSCFTAGFYATAITGSSPLATHTLAETWENGIWAIQGTPNASGKAFNALLGVSCSSSIACSAVGGASPSLTSGATALVSRYE